MIKIEKSLARVNDKIINFLAITRSLFYKKTIADEKTIQEVCDKLLTNNFIGNSECLITTALLAKYFKDKEIKVKVHFGFIGEVETPTNVIESHLWLSYKKKRIDITAHKQITTQGDFSSQGYILNEPIPKTYSEQYFTKGLDKATAHEKEMLHNIVKKKNESSIEMFDSASISKDSSINYSLIEKFINDPYEMEKKSKKNFNDKYEEFKNTIEPQIPNYLKGTPVEKLWQSL